MLKMNQVERTRLEIKLGEHGWEIKHAGQYSVEAPLSREEGLAPEAKLVGSLKMFPCEWFCHGPGQCNLIIVVVIVKSSRLSPLPESTNMMTTLFSSSPPSAWLVLSSPVEELEFRHCTMCCLYSHDSCTPVSKNWNPKTTFPWEKMIFEVIFPMFF